MEILLFALSLIMRIIVIILLLACFQLHAQNRSDSLFSCQPIDTALLKDITPAQYPAGQASWFRWIASWVSSKLKKHSAAEWPSGTYACYFTIDTTGMLTSIGFCGTNDPTGESILKEILYKSPAWKPAVNKEGKKVAWLVKQPITIIAYPD